MSDDFDPQYDDLGRDVSGKELSKRIYDLEERLEEVDRCKRQLRIEFESLRTLLITGQEVDS